MFDRYGKVLCEECMGTMKTVAVGAEKATFQCENIHCAHVASFSLKNYRDHPSDGELRPQSVNGRPSQTL